MLPLLTAVTLAAPLPPLQDWPRFLGPGGHGDGSSLALPARGEKAVRWKIDLQGTGSSSPVVHEGRLVITCMRGQERVVLAYDINGDEPKELWNYAEPVAEFRQHRFNSAASNTPALDDEGVFLIGPDGEYLAAIALDWQGEVRWRRELGEQAARHGGGASPVLHGDLLIVAHDDEGSAGSFLVGLSTADGEEAWRIERSSTRAAYSTPCLREGLNGPELVFASTAHGLTAIDPRDGQITWEIGELFVERVVASPVASGPVIFASAGKGGGGIEAVAVEAPTQERATPEIIWRARRNLPYVPTPLALADGHFLLVSDGGIATKLDRHSGAELWRSRWSEATYGSPIRVGEAICCTSRDGILHAAQAGDAFEDLGSWELGEPADATPAVAAGWLLVRTQSQVLGLRR